MIRPIFVNLPVKDLPRSMAFFKALGLSFNARGRHDAQCADGTCSGWTGALRLN